MGAPFVACSVCLRCVLAVCACGVFLRCVPSACACGVYARGVFAWTRKRLSHTRRVVFGCFSLIPAVYFSQSFVENSTNKNHGHCVSVGGVRDPTGVRGVCAVRIRGVCAVCPTQRVQRRRQRQRQEEEEQEEEQRQEQGRRHPTSHPRSRLPRPHPTVTRHRPR